MILPIQSLILKYLNLKLGKGFFTVKSLVHSKYLYKIHKNIICKVFSVKPSTRVLVHTLIIRLFIWVICSLLAVLVALFLFVYVGNDTLMTH